MPFSPTPSTAVSRPDLAATLLGMDLQANRAGYIGMRLFPVVEVAQQSANVGRIPIAQLLQTQDTSRASGAGYRRGNFQFDELYYATKEHGWEEVVDQRNRNIYRRYFDAEVVATQRARNFVLQNHELRAVALATNTTVHTNAAAAVAWTTPATAVPITDVQTRVKAIRAATGLMPNAVAMDYEAYLAAINTAQVIDRLKYAGFDDPKNITEAALAQLFGVRYVFIAGGFKNTAAEGGLTLAAAWTKTIVGVGRVAETNDVAEPCLGRTFHWAADGSEIGALIESYYEEQVRADIIRARMETDEKEITPEAWQLITGVVA